MSDWPARGLRGIDGLYPQHTGQPCAGCGASITDEERCYADFDHIWHSGCWPKVLAPSPSGVDE